MSVYIELVIFNNFFLDLLLLLSVATLRRRKVKKWRVLVAALIGSISATLYAIAPTAVQYVIRALLAPIMCIVALSPNGKSKLYKFGDFIGTTLVFVLLTFFTGGVIYGVSYAIGVDIKSYATLGFVAMGAVALIICARLIARKRSTAANSICESTVNVGGQSVSVNALRDSGNLLVDDVSGLPVVILSRQLEDRLNIEGTQGFIEVSTVSGNDSMALVTLDGVDVGGKQYKALGALSHQDFGAFDIILQNSMF